MAAIRNLSECPYYEKKYWRRSDIETTLTRFAPKSRFPNVHPKLTSEIVHNMNAKSLTECLEELNRIDDARIILDNEACYQDVFLIKFLVAKPIFNEYDLLIKYDCLRIVLKVLDRFLSLLSSIDINSAKIVTVKSIDIPSLNDRRVITCYNVLSVVNELVCKSIELGLYFSVPNIFELLGRFISTEFRTNSASELSLNKKRLLTLAINNLYLLTRHHDDLDIDLAGPLELVDKLLGLVRVLRRRVVEKDDENEANSREIMLNALYCLANIIEDRRLEELDRGEIDFAMSRLLNELEMIIEQIEWNELRKSNVKASQALTSNLIVLARLAVNPTTRRLIFTKQSLLTRIVFRLI